MFQLLLDWVILPLLASAMILWIEAVVRQGEENSRKTLKDHEQSWAFLEDRAWRMKWYKRVIVLATLINVGLQVGRIVAKNFF